MSEELPAGRRTRDGLARAVAAVHIGYGTLLVVDPTRVTRALGARPGPAALATVRVLGVRHLAQGAVMLAFPRRGVLAAAIVTDALHASTDLLVAVVAPGWRRASGVDALVGGGLGAASLGLRRAPARQRTMPGATA